MHHGVHPDGSEKATVSVKGGVISGLDWKGAQHIWVRSAVVPVPEGVVAWEKEPSESTTVSED
jgi:hypothetical protein